jgi:hypothetical protein
MQSEFQVGFVGQQQLSAPSMDLGANQQGQGYVQGNAAQRKPNADLHG